GRVRERKIGDRDVARRAGRFGAVIEEWGFGVALLKEGDRRPTRDEYRRADCGGPASSTPVHALKYTPRETAEVRPSLAAAKRRRLIAAVAPTVLFERHLRGVGELEDRKSTRLNSSHT